MIRRCGIDEGGGSQGIIFEVSKSFAIREFTLRLYLIVISDGLPIKSHSAK